ncbi:unnamed protein product [Symbiodinium natans]|uniref:Uncharacterized protein n=1 Tax=Symbiodinium natans TaxID=878477 RepID=A0A812S0N3_9DINO|nr:unnamed protein product [Symbiodinium natans]
MVPAVKTKIRAGLTQAGVTAGFRLYKLAGVYSVGLGTRKLACDRAGHLAMTLMLRLQRQLALPGGNAWRRLRELVLSAAERCFAEEGPPARMEMKLLSSIRLKPLEVKKEHEVCVKAMPRKKVKQEHEVRVKAMPRKKVKHEVRVKAMPRKKVKEEIEERGSAASLLKAQVKRMPKKPEIEEVPNLLEKEAQRALQEMEEADQRMSQSQQELQAATEAAKGNAQDLRLQLVQQAHNLAMKAQGQARENWRFYLEKMDELKREATHRASETLTVKKEEPEEEPSRDHTLRRRVILRARKRLRMDEVSEERSEPRKRRRRSSPRRCTARQVYLLREAQRHGEDWDPSRCSNVIEKYGHLMQYISPDDLVFTHLNISPYFRNGPHKGQPLETLLHDLSSCVLDPMDLTALVGVLHSNELRVVCGNRRLSVLKRYLHMLRQDGNEERALNVKVPVYVHMWEDLPRGLQAKYIEASSTVDGKQPEFFPQRSRIPEPVLRCARSAIPAQLGKGKPFVVPPRGSVASLGASDSQMALLEGRWQEVGSNIAYKVFFEGTEGTWKVEKTCRHFVHTYSLTIKQNKVFWGLSMRYWANCDGDFICWYDTNNALAFTWVRVP